MRIGVLQGEYRLLPGKRHPLTPGSGRGEPVPVPDSCRLAVKAVPNAPRSAIVGWAGDTLKIKVHAPALEGRANEALCEFLAGELGLRKSAVSLARGAKSRLKLVDVSGLTLAAVRARLAATGSPG